MTSEEVKASEKDSKKKWQQKHKKKIANYMQLRRLGQTPSQLKQKKIMDKRLESGDNGVRDNGVVDKRLESGDNGVRDNDGSNITISGKTKNLQTLMKVLAFPKGKDLLFPFRKIVIQKKPNEEKPRLVARQLAYGWFYSQVFIKPDGTPLFLNVEGEGDIMLDMKKALKNIDELKKYKNSYIKYNKESHEIVFGNKESETEYKIFEPISEEIDDASVFFSVPCECNQNPTCPICNGRGVKPAPALSYKNDILLCAPDGSIYPTPDVKLEIDSKIMQMLMNKAFKFDNTFPIQFSKDSLSVLISDPNDTTRDSFKKVIPVNYAINNM